MTAAAHMGRGIELQRVGTGRHSFVQRLHLDRDEVDARLIGNGLGNQSLATAWGAIQQHPCCSTQAHSCILARVGNGLCDSKGQLLPHLHRKCV